MKENALFSLVKSLEPTEKRYFKLFSSQRKRNSKYLKIFQLLDKQDEYDEKEIVKIHIAENLPNSLHVTKNYLYKQILKCLRSYHEKHSPEAQIRNLLTEVEILEKKGLFYQGLKLVLKGKKIAYKFNLHHFIIELIEKENSLTSSHRPKNIESVLRELNIKEKIHLEKSKIERNLYFETSYWTLLDRKVNLEDSSKEQIQENWLQEEKQLPPFEDLSFFGKTHYLNIKNYEARFKNNQKAMDSFGQQLIDLWKSNPQMIDLKPRVYLIYANNYLTTCAQLNHWHKFPPLLAELKQLPIKNFNQAGEAFQVIAFKELYYLMNTQKFEEAEASVAYIDEGMKKYKAKIHDARRLTFHYNISILYFMQEKYDEALERILRIINHPKTEHRLDLQRIAYLFELIYHYELGNMLLVSSMSVSLGRRLLRSGKLSVFEKTVLKRLGALSKAADKTEKRKIYTIFKEELDKIAEANPNQLGVEELQIWLTKKPD